jgi:Ca2+-binding EF-hand superfamily protein
LREIKQAVDRKMPILPLRLEDVAVSKSLSYFTSCHHWLDAFPGPLEKHLPTLTTAVRQLIAGQAAASRDKVDAKTVVVVAPRRRRAVWALLPLVLIPMIALAAWHFRPEPPEPVRAPEDASPSITERPPLVDPLVPGYVQLMRKRFGALNSNRGGRIGIKEFQKAAQAQDSSPAQVLQRFNSIDANHDGSIDVAEWIDLCRQTVLQRDVDGDHQLSKEEFQAQSPSLLNVQANPKRTRIPFEKYDFDSDGYVTLEELERGWATFHVD